LVLETLTTHPVDDLPLLVHHVVVFQEVLADLEVACLHALLGRADRARDELVLDRLALLHAEAVHDSLDPLGAEDPKEVVLEGQVEPGRAGIALPSRTPTKLIVDAPRFVPFGADDVETTVRHDSLVLWRGGLPGFLERRVPGLRWRGGRIQSLLRQNRLRQEIGVAAQENI